MTIAEQLDREMRTLSETQQRQVLDYALSLKQAQLERDMDDIISENLPALKELVSI